MKKIIALVLAALMLLTFVGCAKNEPVDDTTIRVGSLKGATSIGISGIINDKNNGQTKANYEFVMETAADAMAAKIINSEVDIALIPANLASVLYNKTGGKISVIDINTLGVLYFVSADNTVTSIDALKGKTIYLTGKGTTPDYSLQYVLGLYSVNLADVKLEYKSEATEVLSALSADSSAVGLLPQPFATAACIQNANLKIVMDLSKTWTDKEPNAATVTGVTVVRNEFLQQHKSLVATFIEEHKKSVQFVEQDVNAAAKIVTELGIIAKEPIAIKAIPNCNTVCVTGNEMKEKISLYLKVLYDMDKASVGGNLPADEFYYIP